MNTMIFDQAATPVSTRETAPHALGISRARLWTSRVMTTLPLLFMTWDGLMKFTSNPMVVEGSARLGFARSTLPVIGTAELLSIALCCFHRTRILGAVLLTAYLGGAVETHVRMGDPLFSHTLFPIYFAVLIWGGLCLRDARVRALSPFAPRAR